PGSLPLVYRVLGGEAGWLALALSAAAAWWCAAADRPQDRLHVLGLVGLAAGVLAASHARAWDTPGRWVSYHVLAACWSGLALSGVAAGWLVPGSVRRGWRMHGWLAGLTAALLVVALAGGWDARGKVLTPAGAALAGCLLAGSAAVWFRQGGFVYCSGLLFV